MGFGNTAPKAKLVPNPKARLREQLREVMRFKRFSRRREGGVLGLYSAVHPVSRQTASAGARYPLSDSETK